jgi:Ca-activated chloride channel homolog
MKVRVFILILLLSGIAQAITPWERYSISEAVGKGTWEASEQIFRKLKETELPPEQIAQVDYNLGVALYGQEKYEESLPLFESAAKTEAEPLKAKALYNQGNALFKLDRLEEAKTAFQQALLANPDDDDTRHNIEVILEKQKQDQDQQDKDKDKDKEKQDQDKQDQENDSKSDQEQKDEKGESDEQKKDQDKQESQDEDSESEQKDGQDKQDQQPGEQKEDQQGQEQEMTEAEKKAAQEAAERARLLDYFKQQERDGRPAQRVRAQAPPVRGKTW